LRILTRGGGGRAKRSSFELIVALVLRMMTGLDFAGRGS
jgi:hypothetical protein